MIFFFQRGKDDFAVCWTNNNPCDHVFERRIIRVIGRDGDEIPVKNNQVKIDASPKYVFFEKEWDYRTVLKLTK